MKKIASVIIILNLLISSCKAPKQDLTFKFTKSDLPIKAIKAKTLEDSTLIGIFIPQEFEIKQKMFSEIDFSTIRFSQTGADMFGSNNSKVYAILNDTLIYEPTIIKLHLSEKNKYKIYVSYYFYVKNFKKDELFENATFTQFKYKRKIYNLGKRPKFSQFLNQKIQDSLKGYIHLNYTNPKTDQFDYFNIPVKF